MNKTKTDNLPGSGATVAGDHFSETPPNRFNKTMVEGSKSETSKDDPNRANVLAGFLVSFSANGAGEYWPLREGNNSIGQSNENDIVLKEKHVSVKHANINISKDVVNNCWKFQLVDLSSTNGTDLNGRRLPIYSGIELKPNDKLKIGEYLLMLVTADKFVNQLTKNENFQSPSQPAGYDSRDYYPTDGDATRADY